MKSKTPIWVYITTKDKEEALNIARTLVGDSLLACANVYDEITSIYRWQGEICEDSEAILIGKTTEEQLPVIKKVLPDLHSYDCPCLISGPIADGLPPFLDWIQEQVNK